MLAQERQKASFGQPQLSHFLYGSPQKFEEFQRIAQMVESDPQLRFDPSFLHQSRSDMMSVFSKKLMRFHDALPLDGSNEIYKSIVFCHAMPFSLHGVMFLNVLRNLCDPEQEKLFLQPALRGEIIGCYAQTELAHGSDVQNLLTTATYDAATESFIINTPEIGATKWWVGDLGVYCNHAAVYAQLIINQKRYGVHAFLVPIRDKTTLKTLNGIQAGDIGPKHGFQLKDNGYAIFNNLRIPRRNMLMKYHVVSKEGEYSLQGDEKISYATMLMTRSGITQILANAIAKITTIGTRYSLLRTQFKDKNGKEIPVLDYQTQQEKIIPRIAESVAAFITARKIGELSGYVFDQAKQGKFDRLNEAHILTSATKAILSLDVLRGAEIVRRSAGGHGFHAYNGIIPIQLESTPLITLQGEFTVLMLQVGRFLLKSLGNLQKGKPLPESVQYFNELPKGVFSVQVGESISPQLVERILVIHSLGKIKAVVQKNAKLKKTNTPKEIQDHHSGLLINDAAIAHSYVVVYNYFAREVEKAADQQVKAVLTKLVLLYGVEKILERASKFYETSTLSAQSMSLLFKHREQLLHELRPESLSLVEAFGYTDSILMSAIGASNGKPYQNLLSWATTHNSLNSKPERDQVIAAIRTAKKQLRPRL